MPRRSKVAQGPLHQAVLLEPADQPGQRALAQVHRLGEFLRPELVLLVRREAQAVLTDDDRPHR
jgi:hypothetical protein